MGKHKLADIEKIRSQGLNLFNQNLLANCLDHLIQNLTKFPNDAVLHLLMGRLSIRLFEPKNALLHFGFILNQLPNNESATSGLISAHLAIGNTEEALAVANNFELTHPRSVLMMLSKADVYEALGDFEQAHEYLLKCVQFNEKNPLSKYHLGESYLRRGELQKGWEGLSYLYAAGFKPTIQTASRIWDGSEINSLLLVADQGLGDAIQFSRYIPWAKNKTKTVTLACDVSLHEFLGTAFGVQTIPIAEVKQFKSDAHLPLMQLAAFCVATNDPYQLEGLKNFDRYNTYDASLKSNNSLNIGIAFDCSSVHPTEQFPHTRRSCKPVDALPLLDIQNAQFYNLQLNPNPEAQKLFGNRWHETGHTLQNFMDTVNWIKKMDMVITVDTALVHIAGSIGKKGYLVLPLCNDWRWQISKVTNQWYHSVEILKQNKTGQWSSIFTDLTKFEEMQK
jgi:tetratricopeptide (TPR) repeat protein